MSMRICTWNINSVRLRAPLLTALVDALNPDVVCLQETKVVDSLFPLAAFEQAGYRHAALNGIKNYNGVAILSRHPMTPLPDRAWCGRADGRHVAVQIDGPAGPFELHNFYVPSGGDVPDPQVNDKFAHKLAFVAEMRQWFRAERSADRPMVLVGDLNIAPYEHDVWSHRQLLDVVSHTPVEVDALNALRDDLGWTDTARHFVSSDEKLYSWWSYRARDWRRSDRGRRLDHIWVSPALSGALGGVHHLKDARDWDRPSDHVPVALDLG